MAKIRLDFVTNSSSSSFVICKSSLPKEIKEKVTSYIEKNFNNTSIEDLILDINNYDPELYNLVEYDSKDDEMHIWVKRDECMCDDFIDDILYNYNANISPKFDCYY